MTIKLLTTDQVAEILGVKVATLRVWRMQGKGPRFRKIGALVRYDEAVLTSWIDNQMRSSTSQKAPPAEAALA
jgi:predicted DNA-binding transcriptional regulator AlpA